MFAIARFPRLFRGRHRGRQRLPHPIILAMVFLDQNRSLVDLGYNRPTRIQARFFKDSFGPFILWEESNMVVRRCDERLVHASLCNLEHIVTPHSRLGRHIENLPNRSQFLRRGRFPRKCHHGRLLVHSHRF